MDVHPDDGNLARFAIAELKRAGLDQTDADYGGMLADDVLELVRVFERQGHSGGSAHQTLRLFGQVARFRPLVPLTSSPEEWMQVESRPKPVWQSRRRPDAFSHDGGRSYYLLDERRPWWRRALGLGRTMHLSA
jgi:hypothetical protein